MDDAGLSDALSFSRRASVSGTWEGSYSGTFTGTFKLTWQQSKANLSGTIKISGFGNVPTTIHWTLHGTSIHFGTVGPNFLEFAETW